MTTYIDKPSDRILGKLNQGIDKVAAFAMSMLLILAIYSIWNIYQVYAGAAIDAKIEGFKPNGDNSELGFSELQAINKDVIAWLTIDDTNIDYPVLQSDDNATYLNRDVYGNFSVSGSIFTDYKNAPDFSDFYTIVYGHHMDKGAMFGDIDKFLSKDFFDSHTSGTLYLKDKTLKLDIVACIKADAYDKYFYKVDYTDESKQNELVEYIKETATNAKDFSLEDGETLIALSTCSTASTNGRTILLAVAR